MSKIDEQCDFKCACIQVVEHLRAMFIVQVGDRFDFYDDPLETHKVRFEGFAQEASFIGDGQRLFGNEENALQREFDLQTFLIDWFSKATTLLVINFETGTIDLESFVTERKACWHIYKHAAGTGFLANIFWGCPQMTQITQMGTI